MTDVNERLLEYGKQMAKKNGGSIPVICRGSDEWKAWRQWRKDHKLPVSFMDQRERWTVPTVWPPMGEEWLSQTQGRNFEQ